MNWRWALRDLLRHRARTGLSLLGVAIATALLLDMVLLSGGIERSFGRLLVSRGFQLRVSPRGTLPFDTEATLDSADQLVAALRAEPGVAQVGAVPFYFSDHTIIFIFRHQTMMKIPDPIHNLTTTIFKSSSNHNQTFLVQTPMISSNFSSN